MLQIKFFQVNGNYYVKARHDGHVVDTTHLPNIYMQAADYIKKVMTWGYDRSEITFIIDPTCEDAESIAHDIEVYADR